MGDLIDCYIVFNIAPLYYNYIPLYTITIIYEFHSEEGDIGPFVSTESLSLKYRLCPLLSRFSVICF